MEKRKKTPTGAERQGRRDRDVDQMRVEHEERQRSKTRQGSTGRRHGEMEEQREIRDSDLEE